jgi:hypothetical protein
MEELLLACIWGEEMHYSRVSHFCEEKKTKKKTHRKFPVETKIPSDEIFPIYG